MKNFGILQSFQSIFGPIMEIRERIIEEAKKEFIQNGVRSVTMDDIAQNLSISKRTIYENFRDKNELLKSCLESMWFEQSRRNEEVIKNTANVIEAIFQLMQIGINAIRTYNPLFGLDLKKYHASIWAEANLRSEETGFNQIYRLLRKGINENLFRKNINVEIVTKILQEQLKALSDDNAFPKDKYKMDVVFENMIINFIRGIATAKGHEIIDSFVE